MKKNTLFLLFICLSFICQVAFSQEEEQSSKIKVYTPESSVNSESNAYKWAVKTDLFSFVAGEFPIIAEYKIAKKFSIEGSAGITYAFWPNGNSFFANLIEDDENNFDSSNNTKAGIGSAFRAGFKYYPSSDYDAIEGWGFGIQLFMTTHNREYNDDITNNGLNTTSSFEDSEKRMGAALTISSQLFWDSNISYEYFFSVGFTKIKRNYAVTSTNYINNASRTIFEPKTNENSTPSIKIGLRIGFGN